MHTKMPLRRSKTDKMFTGTAAGVANYFGVSPTFVRVLWGRLRLHQSTDDNAIYCHVHSHPRRMVTHMGS